MGQLDPGRTAMIALARIGSDFHFAQQRVHLGHRQLAPGADRAMAGDRRRDEVEPVAERDRSPKLGGFTGEVGQ